MKKTLLALTSALVLTGTMSSAALAQTYYSDRSYDYSDSRYSNDAYIDADRDGLQDMYDRYDDLRNVTWDRDRDGRNDRYEDDGGRYADERYSDSRYSDSSYYDRGVRRWDRDGDGVPNRYDRYDDRRHMASHRYQAGRYYGPRNYRYTRYEIGSRLPPAYYGSSYYVDYRPYGLQAPPRGYRWNRVGNDVYLVSTYNGLVRDVMYSLFY